VILLCCLTGAILVVKKIANSHTYPDGYRSAEISVTFLQKIRLLPQAERSIVPGSGTKMAATT
jgi:hypothetical protein